jgi:hypothetical protein
MVSNSYLVQALRSYREKSEGQFGRTTERMVQVTQDAADEIERLNAEVAKLQDRKIAIGVKTPITSGNYARFGWQQVAEALQQYNNGDVSFYTLVATESGIEAYGSILPNRA